MNATTNKSSLFTIFLTVFIDLLGVGIAIPVTAPLLLSPESLILPATMSISNRTIIFGFVVACFPLAQFFGAPILGALSDRHGRRKILMISLFGTLLGYVLFAIAIITNNIYLLFASRTLDGFTGGNISIAVSAISDISDEKAKAKNFGLVGAAFGLGVILGPYIGGKLAEPDFWMLFSNNASFLNLFTHATPFWFAAFMSLVNIVLVFYRFPETLTVFTKTTVSMYTGIRNIVAAFSLPHLRSLFTVVFLLSLGFNFFTQFFNVFLITKFQYSISNIADMFAYIGLWIVIAQGALQRPLSKKVAPIKLLRFAALLLGLTMPFLLFPDKPIYLLLVIPFIAMFKGLTQPNINAVVSDQVGKGEQGRIFGINQSIQSLGMALPPIIAAFINKININFPIISSSICIVAGWFILIFYFKTKNQVQHNTFTK